MHSSHKPNTAQLKERVQTFIEQNDHTGALRECAWFAGHSAVFYAGVLDELRKEEMRLNYVTPDMEKVRSVIAESIRLWAVIPQDIRDLI